MSGFDHEHFSEGDWDGKNEMEWNEFDWQQYLKRNEQDILRFLNLYLRPRKDASHLDEVARQMGWGDDEWAPAEESADEEDDFAAEAVAESPLEDDRAPYEPYTVHRHPVYIVTTALYRHLRSCWEQFTLAHPKNLPPALGAQFNTSLHAGESNAVMAVASLDVGDFTLAVCHLKNALSAINHTLGMLQHISKYGIPAFTLFQHDAQTALFDLREVWLRVMRDCRDEARRPRDGE